MVSSFHRHSCFRPLWIMKMIVFFVVCASMCGLQGVQSKWVEGEVRTSSSNWEFLTRFCFLSEKGRLEYEFRYPVGYGTLDILLYYDTPGQWESVYDRGLTCDEKAAVLSITSNQIISLNTSNTQTSSHSGCILETYNGDTWYHCASNRAFRSTRERWWYIVLARCGESKDKIPGLHADFKIHMTNGDDLLHEEFSADEFYILPVDIAFLLVYLIIGVLAGICAVLLRHRHLFHSTYKLFMVSVYTWILSLALKVIAWTHYGVTGWEWSSTEVSGRVSAGLSQVVFILMLILMGKGYTITRGSLVLSSKVKIAVFITLYFIITVALFVWEGLFFDEGKVLYYYESPPGYCMVALQLVAWFWFLYSTIFTLKHSASQSIFYIPFFAFYTLWFWASPIIILVAMSAMPKWGREKTVNGTEQLLAFLGHVVFLVLTRPSAANSNFPYHVRTSQISSMKEEDDDDGKSRYHFDKGDTSDYTITGNGPNLDFFITSSKRSDDNLNIIDYSDNNNGNSSLGSERWFNGIAPPPYTEETSSLPVSDLPQTASPTFLQSIGYSPQPQTVLHPASQMHSTDTQALEVVKSNEITSSLLPPTSASSSSLFLPQNSLAPIITPRDIPLSLIAKPSQIDNDISTGFYSQPSQIIPPNLNNSSFPTLTPLNTKFLPPIITANISSSPNSLSPINNSQKQIHPPRLTTTTSQPALVSYGMPNLCSPKLPTPRTDKHMFSSTIAILTKTADATCVDDVINKDSKSTKNPKKKNKGKGSTIMSKSVEELYINNNNVKESIDTASRNILTPVGFPLLRRGVDSHRQLSSFLPPLPIAAPLPTPTTTPGNESVSNEGDNITSSNL